MVEWRQTKFLLRFMKFDFIRFVTAASLNGKMQLKYRYRETERYLAFKLKLHAHLESVTGSDPFSLSIYGCFHCQCHSI
jgi:hypothetical protein